MSYADFLTGKRRVVTDSGRVVDSDELHPSLKPHQRDLTLWALRKGRAAIWADTGLGKTRMLLEWARLTKERTLILGPLAVAHQTVREAAALGFDVAYVRDQTEADEGPPIVISNYERLHLFHPAQFGAVVLDESSILKAFSGTTKKALVKAFADTPWRLCCTATPAPNDIEELCNHADFLGVMKPSEMRSTFFIADNRGQFMKYRVKGHARAAFYRWLSTWAAAISKPSDLGHDDAGYALPPLNITATFVESDYVPEGQLFVVQLKGVSEASAVRRHTLEGRVAAAAELITDSSPWLMWCGLNAEQEGLIRVFGDRCVSIDGSTPLEKRLELEDRWKSGSAQVMVTKPEVYGFGVNWQHCAQMAFVGIGYSFETYYQAIRRCWRFGQSAPVNVHLVLSDVERDVLATVQAKEAAHAAMTAGLMAELGDLTRAEVLGGTSAADDYEPRAPVRVPAWIGTA